MIECWWCGNDLAEDEATSMTVTGRETKQVAVHLGQQVRIDSALGFASSERICLPPGDVLMKCTDCGLAGRRDAEGLYHGIRDVEPCPVGADDFHHYEAL